jgi:hypothetical protein
MPGQSIPLRKTAAPRPGHPPHSHSSSLDNADADADSHTFSSPIHLSRDTSPFPDAPRNRHPERKAGYKEPESPHSGSDLEFDDWDEHDAAMPSDLRPEIERDAAPLLGHKADDEGHAGEAISRRSTFHERDPQTQARYETRKRYTYAGIFLALSLVSFTVQTETAVYIQHELKWEKPYCML